MNGFEKNRNKLNSTKNEQDRPSPSFAHKEGFAK